LLPPAALKTTQNCCSSWTPVTLLKWRLGERGGTEASVCHGLPAMGKKFIIFPHNLPQKKINHCLAPALCLIFARNLSYYIPSRPLRPLPPTAQHARTSLGAKSKLKLWGSPATLGFARVVDALFCARLCFDCVPWKSKVDSGPGPVVFPPLTSSC
jgi:hypothetical protein